MNRKTLLALAGLGAFSHCWAVPIVSNVRMQQIEGTKDVRITYDLADNVNTQLWIDVSVVPKASVANWGTGTLPLKMVDGDAFRWVSPGQDRQLVWHAGRDWNGRYTDMAQAFVRAKIPNDKYGISADRSLLFSVGGSTYWYKSSGGYSGYCASAYSGTLYAYSELSTKVMGPGTISFYWKASSTDHSYVSLYLYVDGSSCTYAKSTSWSCVNYEITSPGLHTIVWKFNRGSSYNSGATYYAYVDSVEWHESP